MTTETEWLECPIDLSRVPSAVDIIRAQVREELPQGWEDMLYEEHRDLEWEQRQEAAEGEPRPDGAIWVDDVPIPPELGA